MTANNRKPFPKKAAMGHDGAPGINLLGPNGQPTNVQLVAAQLASPTNDDQILCLMAADLDAKTGGGMPPEAIAERCFLLMAHIVEGHKHGKLHEAHIAARKLYADPRDAEEAQAPKIVVQGGSGQ